MIKTIKVIFILILLVFLGYLILPASDFPSPPPDSIRSFEPADVETPLRRGYYTDFTRNEVMNYYFNQFKRIKFMNILLPTYILNYPPEEAQVLIRDQARSTFLEEIVHPFRESIFVNGFEPKEAKDAIVVEEKNLRQKIIIRYIPTSPYIRVVFGTISIALIYLLTKEYFYTLKKIKHGLN